MFFAFFFYMRVLRPLFCSVKFMHFAPEEKNQCLLEENLTYTVKFSTFM